MRRLQELKRNSSAGPAPLMVHCSAGIGRTGVFILLETSLAHFQGNTVADLGETLKRMREQRMGMVQTEVRSPAAMGLCLILPCFVVPRPPFHAILLPLVTFTDAPSSAILQPQYQFCYATLAQIRREGVDFEVYP